jgi:hypothetical protein
VDRISERDTASSITIDHLNTVAQQGYLDAVAAELKALAIPSSSSDIISAFKQLFAKHQIVVSEAHTTSAAKREQVRKSCEADLREFDAAYFGLKIPTPAASGEAVPAAAAAIPLTGLLSLLGPMGSLGGTIIGIVEPVLTSFADLASDAAKKEAIKQFLRDNDTQSKLRQAGTGVGRTESDYLFAKRLALAGAFAEKVALVTGKPLPLTSAQVQAACQAPFADMYRRGPNGLPTARFRRCYQAVWEHFEKGITAALQTAAAYDQLADAGDTSTHLNNYARLTQNFSPIIDDSGEDVWNMVSRMITFAAAVKTALSEENRKKLEQAFEALGKDK